MPDFKIQRGGYEYTVSAPTMDAAERGVDDLLRKEFVGPRERPVGPQPERGPTPLEFERYQTDLATQAEHGGAKLGMGLLEEPALTAASFYGGGVGLGPKAIQDIVRRKAVTEGLTRGGFGTLAALTSDTPGETAGIGAGAGVGKAVGSALPGISNPIFRALAAVSGGLGGWAAQTGAPALFGEEPQPSLEGAALSALAPGLPEGARLLAGKVPAGLQRTLGGLFNRGFKSPEDILEAAPNSGASQTSLSRTQDALENPILERLRTATSRTDELATAKGSAAEAERSLGEQVARSRSQMSSAVDQAKRAKDRLTIRLDDEITRLTKEQDSLQGAPGVLSVTGPSQKRLQDRIDSLQRQKKNVRMSPEVAQHLGTARQQKTAVSRAQEEISRLKTQQTQFANEQASLKKSLPGLQEELKKTQSGTLAKLARTEDPDEFLDMVYRLPADDFTKFSQQVTPAEMGQIRESFGTWFLQRAYNAKTGGFDKALDTFDDLGYENVKRLVGKDVTRQIQQTARDLVTASSKEAKFNLTGVAERGIPAALAMTGTYAATGGDWPKTIIVGTAATAIPQMLKGAANQAFASPQFGEMFHKWAMSDFSSKVLDSLPALRSFIQDQIQEHVVTGVASSVGSTTP